MYQIYADDTLIYDNSVPAIFSAENVAWTKSVDLDDLTRESVYITSGGVWDVPDNPATSPIKSVFVQIPDNAKKLTMRKTGSGNGYYAFLTASSYSDGATPSYATGQSGRTAYTGLITVQIPADAHYVWIYTHTNAADNAPESMAIYGINAGELVQKQGAVNPRLNLTAGAAGSLEMTLTPVSAGYNTVKRLTSTIRVLRDGTEIWRGRVLSESSDLWKDRVLTCEGAMAYLNDTVYMGGEQSGTGAYLLALLLGSHNTAAVTRQIQVGVCTVSGTLNLSGDIRSTYEAVNSLVSDYGGILRTRISGGVVYLDWLADYPATASPQTIRFGENMLDYAPTQDCTDFATAVYVRGAEIQDSEGQGTGTFYNSGWVYNTATITAYGWVARYLDMSDLTSDLECYNEAARWLNQKQYDELTLSISALDLHVLNPNVQPFNLLEKVHVSSVYHGMEKDFAVIGLSINLDDPGKTGFTLGDPVVAYKRRVKTLTEQTVQAVEDAHQEVEAANAYTEQKAEEAASALSEAVDEINDTMNSLSQGYIFIDTDGTDTQGIYIVEHPIHDLSEIQSGWDVWKWSADGFGHTDAWAGDQTVWNVAITHDGKINADRILTGLLMAQYIKLYGNMKIYASASSPDNQPSGFIGYGTGETGDRTTGGVHMYRGSNQNGWNEIIVTNTGVRMTYGRTDAAYEMSIYVSANGVHITGPNGAACNLEVTGDIYYGGSLINGPMP
jgi:hypothetical protein